MTKILKSAFLFSTLLRLAFPLLAGEQTLTLDPETSQVTFVLEATGHDVHGNLFLQSGEIRFDPVTGAATGEVKIDARRSETGSRRRDKKMHKMVLKSEEHALIVFTAERMEGKVATTGASNIQLYGTVSLLGVEHSLTLAVDLEIEVERLRATTTFTVPYVEWGLPDPSILFLRVGKVVEVTVSAEGMLTAPEIDDR